MDFDLARFNMIEQQIRPWEVLDPEVLEALNTVKREDYVTSELRALAFADLALPIGEGEVMMQPKVEARLIQALAPDPGESILEIGTGSGYVTALLCVLAGRVTSIEIRPGLAATAGERLARDGRENATVVVGDGARGWSEGGPYDGIILTGSTPILPDAFRESLAPGGRLVAVVGQEPIMEAVLVERVDETGYRTRSLFDTVVPPLVNAQSPAAFVF